VYSHIYAERIASTQVSVELHQGITRVYVVFALGYAKGVSSREASAQIAAKHPGHDHSGINQGQTAFLEVTRYRE